MLGSTYSRDNGWNNFIKIQKIGTGVYGKVYKAKDRETGDFVAVKKTPLDVEGVPATTVREIMILKRISGHDNIVK